jgi:hypothetical protein
LTYEALMDELLRGDIVRKVESQHDTVGWCCNFNGLGEVERKVMTAEIQVQSRFVVPDGQG